MEPFLNERLSIDENPTPTLLIKKKQRQKQLRYPEYTTLMGGCTNTSGLRTQDSGEYNHKNTRHCLSRNCSTELQQNIFYRKNWIDLVQGQVRRISRMHCEMQASGLHSQDDIVTCVDWWCASVMSENRDVGIWHRAPGTLVKLYQYLEQEEDSSPAGLPGPWWGRSLLLHFPRLVLYCS